MLKQNANLLYDGEPKIHYRFKIFIFGTIVDNKNYSEYNAENNKSSLGEAPMQT